jgi:hypothetical protein
MCDCVLVQDDPIHLSRAMVWNRETMGPESARLF